MADIKVVELFAGVGGFRLGLEAASDRYKVIWANQWEPYKSDQWAFDCYVSHFGKSPDYVCQDIAIAKDRVPDHDLLVGGFPCQDYSIMKKISLGIEGKKGVLWWQIYDILKDKRPSYVILENVDRLIRSPAKQCGRDLSIILRCFYQLGYCVEWRVINAADYGQAQRRRRTFLVAYHNRTDRSRNFAERVCKQGLKALHKQVVENGILAKAFPIATHRQQFVDQWIDEMRFESVDDIMQKQKVYLHNAGVMINGRIYSVEVIPKYEAFIPLRNILERGPIDEHFFLNEKDMSRWIYAKGAKHEQRKRKDGSVYWFNEGAVGFPDSLENPSRTMLTSETQVGRTSHVVTDLQTERLRVLTPIECERLNGFPDNWTDTGMPEKMRYFCMGNALVVSMVTRICKSLLDFTPKCQPVIKMLL